ncbi:MAG: roadblock/LC7 domain-containing protein [Thermoplasmatota archaeon]|nr:roadblock/LC7 domain-containing protein [Halobacteriales archaeon]
MDRGDQVRAVLARLVDGKTRWGAAVVSRDGMTVAARMARAVSDDSFSAMAAAMLGAAESAMQEWSDDRPQRATVEGKTVRLTAVSLDNDFFLAVLAPVGASPASSAIEVDAAAARLRAVLREPTVIFQETQETRR